MNRPITALSIALCLITLMGCQKAFTPAAASDSAVATPAAEEGKAAGPAASKAADSADDALPVVKIETARTGTIEKLLPLSGILMAARDQEATIASPIAGVLDRFPLHVGDTVRKGDLIAHLSTAPLLGQVAQARAGISEYDITAQQAQVAALQQQTQTRSAVLQAQAAVSAAHAAVLGAQATLTADQAAVANAQQSLNRAKSLFDQGLVARKDVEAANFAELTASAQVNAQKQTIAGLEETLASQRQALSAAQASRLQDAVKQKDIGIALAQRANALGVLATTEAQAALYTIRTPLSGVVTAVNAGLGESVDSTTKIVTIANLDRLQLNVSVPSSSSGVLHAGQPLVFTVDSMPGQTFRASVRTIGTQVDPTNGTINVIADVDNPFHKLKDDLSVQVGLVTARHRSVVVVPKSAVFFDTGSAASTGMNAAASVLRIDADNVAHKVDVTTGFTEGDQIEITSGIKAGEHVASTGGYGLADGTKVKSADEADSADKKPNDMGAAGHAKADAATPDVGKEGSGKDAVAK